MISEAWAGHAGETTISAFMPHELMGGLVLLLLALLALLVLTVATLFRVVRLERRLLALEGQLKKTSEKSGAGHA